MKILTKSYMLFNCGTISTHYNCIFIFFLPPWRWPLEWPKHVGD